MSLDEYKAQAKLLLAYLRQNATTTPSHSYALGAIAALHGYSDWNALQTKILEASGAPVVNSPGEQELKHSVDSSTPAPILGEFLKPGTLTGLIGPIGSGKSWWAEKQIDEIIAAGGTATILDVYSGYEGLCRMSEGIFCPALDLPGYRESALMSAPIVSVDFSGFGELQQPQSSFDGLDWATILQMLILKRTARAKHLFVMDESGRLFDTEMRRRLVTLLSQAKALGSSVLVIGQTELDLEALTEENVAINALLEQKSMHGQIRIQGVGI